jgi:ZIP family zinc transporter
MTDIIQYDFHHVMIAFALTIGAAAATMIGGLSVLTARIANPRLLAFGLAFAGGAMVYISLVEIFGKSNLAFSEIYDSKSAYTMATILFFCGVGLLAVIDRLIPNPHNELTKISSPEADQKYLARVGLMAALAITIHNFPEGMATFFATLDNPVVGAPLAIAIAVHNIPEGVSIAVPVYYATNSKKMALLACLISAIAEPVGAALGYFVLAPFLTPFVFGSVFGIIAGAMVFLALDELLPSAKRYASGHDAVYGMIIGMGMVALSLVLFK